MSSHLTQNIVAIKPNFISGTTFYIQPFHKKQLSAEEQRALTQYINDGFDQTLKPAYYNSWLTIVKNFKENYDWENNGNFNAIKLVLEKLVEIVK